MKKNNADYLVKKLKKFSLPMPRKSMTLTQLKEVKTQLEEIEQSIIIYRENLKRFSNSNQQ